ncbi:MAG: hypothetical protein BWK73_25430 [Thiothrix lacustris]|uniref:Uncharacterized protein n=1 Tax=Thiothrix lacustris TaxID=525917 RepID=A0A1Y1QL82_9GAMM|nr:MAG: hypothetical protein BWK73_25430 [Thiothrix lacustris]
MRKIALILELVILLVAVGGGIYKYAPDFFPDVARGVVRISPNNTPGIPTDGCPPLLKGCTCAIALDGKPEPVPPAHLKFMLSSDCIAY